MAEHGSTEIQEVVEELYIEGNDRDFPCIIYSDGRLYVDYSSMPVDGEPTGLWINWKFVGNRISFTHVDGGECSMGPDTEQMIIKWATERALIESL